jgi:hypothetical protein
MRPRMPDNKYQRQQNLNPAIPISMWRGKTHTLPLLTCSLASALHRLHHPSFSCLHFGSTASANLQNTPGVNSFRIGRGTIPLHRDSTWVRGKCRKAHQSVSS